MTRAGVLARASVFSSLTSVFDHSRRFAGFLATGHLRFLVEQALILSISSTQSMQTNKLTARKSTGYFNLDLPIPGNLLVKTST
jgi:hypothetical protein